MDARYGGTELAWEYDQRNSSLHPGELEWYLSHVGTQADERPILELASGTGRLTLPLLASGYPVIAVDNSQPMLDRLLAKVESLDPESTKRLQVVHDDMTSFVPAETCRAIAVPYNSMKYLSSVQQLEQMIDHIRSLLPRDGVLLIDLYCRDPMQYSSPAPFEHEISDESSGLTVRERSTTVASEDHQFIVSEQSFTIVQSGQERSISTRRQTPALTRFQWIDLVRQHGFEVDAKPGFAEGAIDGAWGQLCLCCALSVT